MYGVLLTLHILVSVLLIISILLQAGKGSDLGQYSEEADHRPFSELPGQWILSEGHHCSCSSFYGEFTASWLCC